MSDKFNFKRVITPIGTAEWPYINRPDTKWNELGEYKVNLVIPKDEAEAFIGEHISPLIESTLEEAQGEADAKAAKAKRKAKPVKEAEFKPYEEMEDGSYIFKTKRDAKVVKDDGTTYEFDVKVVDANGKQLSPEEAANLRIGNGTVMRAMVSLKPYNMPTQGVGVSLRLEKVQILKLVEFKGNSGFDSVETEDAFVHQATEDSGFEQADGGYVV